MSDDKCANTAPVVLVHGGAGDIPDVRVPLKLAGVKRAAAAGHRVIVNGGSVLDAVETAVRIMEDDEAFNAGRGSALTLDATVEMDAIVMEGSTLCTGAVTVVGGVANPVTVARLVMDKTPHILLAGPAASRFAQSHGVPVVGDDWLVTDFARQALDDYLHGRGGAVAELGHGTVGAVAVDASSKMACATSTGGTTGKMVGRVGDTPQVGSGGYCDDRAGACSATGHGESIARVVLCRHITGLMADGGLEPKPAAELALQYMKERTGGVGGAISLSKEGRVGVAFTSRRMAWAYASRGQLHYGIETGDDFVEDLPLDLS